MDEASKLSLESIEKELDSPDGTHFKLFILGVHASGAVAKKFLTKEALRYVNWAKVKGLLQSSQDWYQGEPLDVICFTPFGKDVMNEVYNKWREQVLLEAQENPEEFYDE